MLQRHQSIRKFLSLLSPGSRILDAGCGSGRDIILFRSLGYHAEGFDGSLPLVKLARKHTSARILHRTFAHITYEGEFDAISANASLLHLNQDQLKYALERLRIALKPCGFLRASFKTGKDERIDERGVFYQDFTVQSFREFIAGISGWKECYLEDHIADVLNRDNTTWLVAIIQKD